MNREYLNLAYERSFIKALIRHAQGEYLRCEGQNSAKSQIVCEEAPQALSVVPEEKITEFLVKLEIMQRDNELEMSKYSMVKVKNEKESSPQKATGQGSGSQGSEQRGRERRQHR